MGRCASGIGGEGAPEACASAAGISVSPCACEQDGECEDACGPLCPHVGGPTWVLSQDRSETIDRILYSHGETFCLVTVVTLPSAPALSEVVVWRG